LQRQYGPAGQIVAERDAKELIDYSDASRPRPVLSVGSLCAQTRPPDVIVVGRDRGTDHALEAARGGATVCGRYRLSSVVTP
jgi:hypothetical protein